MGVEEDIRRSLGRMVDGQPGDDHEWRWCWELQPDLNIYLGVNRRYRRYRQQQPEQELLHGFLHTSIRD